MNIVVNMDELPIFDLDDLDSIDVFQLVKCLEDTSCLLIKASSIFDNKANLQFIDMMERYFNQSSDMKSKDIRTQSSYQVGYTPESLENSRCIGDSACQQIISQQSHDNKAHQPIDKDPKCRFMWSIGSRPLHSAYTDLNASPVVPELFKHEWPTTMDTVGKSLLSAIHILTKLIEQGLSLPTGQLSSLLKDGAHLLAPTGIMHFYTMSTMYCVYYLHT